MKRIGKSITTILLIILIPFTIAAGQEKKSEQRIKIVIADEGGTDVVLDTLINGKPLSDSIVLKNGKTVYLAQEGSDNVQGGSGIKKFTVTTTSADGSDSGKEINKSVTIISSDSDVSEAMGKGNCKHAGCGSSGTARTYTYTIQSDSKDSDTEKTKYVITRDGVVITVEGGDYEKVKDLTKEIEKTLDSKSDGK
jgi:hypothetical protein